LTEEQAVNAHQMAVQSHRLNLLVAFFFPLATLVAIFGSEMKHGLEEYLPHPYYLFYIVTGVGLVLGGLLAGWLGFLNKFRKNKH